jgi:hypothetical protein
MKKYLLYFILLLLVLLGSGRLYYRLTDGFRMSQVSMELPYRQEWEIRELSQQEKAQLEEAYSQPYHYLDKGHQAYVFASRDGQYVLKLLKFQRVRVADWLRRTSLPFGWEEWRKRRIEKKDQMLNSLLLSWKLAFDALKEEAAIVYVHINPTEHLKQKLQLVDKIGLRHELDLDRAIFLIQRRAPLLAPTLDEMMAASKEADAKALLDQLLTLFVSEYRRGLAEKELFILRNTGVLEGRPIHIDTGRFEWDQALIRPENYRSELRRKTLKLRAWLEERYPELSAYLDQRLQEVE